jgi:hypothetical protein
MRAAVMWFPQRSAASPARFHKILIDYVKSALKNRRAGNECGKKRLQSWKEIMKD